jgi:hypothetical protein
MDVGTAENVALSESLTYIFVCQASMLLLRKARGLSCATGIDADFRSASIGMHAKPCSRVSFAPRRASLQSVCVGMPALGSNGWIPYTVAIEFAEPMASLNPQRITRSTVAALRWVFRFLARRQSPLNTPATAVVVTRSEDEFRETIEACARACLEHEEPSLYALAYCSELIEEGWTEADAAQVWIKTLRVLARLGKDRESENAATESPTGACLNSQISPKTAS